MPNLVGIGLSQVPTNGMLGGMAYQDPEHASIKNLDLKNLSQINSEIADTAVDVFVYDTRKDSDGGAWRKRTQNTSWYNETLGTATRGTRKEFPAVAVIVAESGQVTIYDGDDPDLPMWIVFTGSVNPVNASGKMIFGTTHISCSSALNGILMVGASGQALSRINFISDGSFLYWSHNIGGNYRGNISERNNDKGYDTVGIALVGNSISINDVAMTVLPNASVDSATGLPVPTIAVATASGVSVIKDDGTVVDITANAGSNYNNADFITISSDGFLVFPQHGTGSAGEYSLMTIPIPDSDRTTQTSSGNATDKYIFNDPNSALTSLPHGLGFTQNGALKIPGTQFLNYPNGLAILSEKPSSLGDAMVNYITKDYNTGWMQGDIKGAFLSDTDIEDGVELVSNGTFHTNTTGWTVVGGASATVSSGQVQLTNNGTTNSSLDQTVTTVVGKTYEISATITPQGGGPLPRLYVGNKYVQVGSNSNSAQTVTLTFLAYSTSTIVSINANTNVNNAVTLADNVSMKLTNDVIGTNLIANGDFSTSSTAAFTTVGGGTAAVVSGLLRLTDTSGSFCYASAPFATVIGKQYFVSVDIVNSSNTANANYIRIGHSHNGTQNHNVNYGTSYGTKEIYITATATTTYLTLISGNGSNETGHWDNISITLVEEDRSVNNKGLQVFGTVTKSAVATGAELVAYSGFTAANYLSYNASDMAFGTGDFSVSLWCIPSTDTTNEFILELDDASQGSNRFYFLTTNTATKRLYTPWDTDIAGSDLTPGQWNHVVVGRKSGYGFVYVNNKWIADGYKAWTTALNGNGNGTISNYSGGVTNDYAWSGSLALLRISGTAPTAEQVSKMYHDEKVLFQENAKATLYGSSDAVTALAYDEVTDQLHVGTSSGRSDFQGLRRINNTTTAVTTAISAHDEFIIEQ